MRPLLLRTTAAQTIHWGDHLLSRVTLPKRLECDLGTPAFTVPFATSPLLLFVGSRPRCAVLGRACSRRLAMAPPQANDRFVRTYGPPRPRRWFRQRRLPEPRCQREGQSDKSGRNDLHGDPPTPQMTSCRLTQRWEPIRVAQRSAVAEAAALTAKGDSAGSTKPPVFACGAHPPDANVEPSGGPVGSPRRAPKIRWHAMHTHTAGVGERQPLG